MFLQYNALLRFYFHIDPDVLSDENWIKLVNQLVFALNFDGRFRSTNGEMKLF